MSKSDYYKILGVDKNVNDEDLKKSFRKLSKLYHPDTTTDVDKKKELEEEFKKINEAYSVLSDPDKRAAFDNPPQQQHFHGGNPFGNRNPFGGHFGGDINLDEILNNVHGFRFSFGGPGGQGFTTSTQMISHTVTLDLLKVLEGGDVEFDIPQIGKRIKFELPPDVQHGRQYKVRISGDDQNQTILQININIELPKGLSKEKIAKIRDILAPEVKEEPTTPAN